MDDWVKIAPSGPRRGVGVADRIIIAHPIGPGSASIGGDGEQPMDRSARSSALRVEVESENTPSRPARLPVPPSDPCERGCRGHRGVQQRRVRSQDARARILADVDHVNPARRGSGAWARSSGRCGGTTTGSRQTARSRDSNGAPTRGDRGGVHGQGAWSLNLPPSASIRGARMRSCGVRRRKSGVSSASHAGTRKQHASPRGQGAICSLRPYKRNTSLRCPSVTQAAKRLMVAGAV